MGEVYSVKFPLPPVKKQRFTRFQYPKPNIPRNRNKFSTSFYDDGECRGCGKKNQYTCRVEGIPCLCENCYHWMQKYSLMDDPYRISRTREGTVVEDKLVKQAIRYAKVKTMDAVGITSMTTGSILFHAYKDVFKELLHEAAVEAETENRSADIEIQEEIRSQEELEEEVRIQERKQERDRRIRENQRITAAQQARRSRLAGKNKTKNHADNLEFKKQETRVKVKKSKASKPVEEEKEIKDTKLDVFWKRYKIHIIVSVIAFILFPPIRDMILLLIWILIIRYYWSDIKEAFKRFK